MNILAILFAIVMLIWFFGGLLWRGISLWRDRRILEPDSPHNLRPYAKSIVLFTAVLLIGLKAFST